jgi:hypothetical protein
MSDFTEVLSFLKKQGVEVSAEAEATAKKKFDGQVLVPSDRVLAEGMIAISKDFNDSKTEDLKTFKERARKAEAERDELRQVLDSGENTSKKKVEKLLAENERLKSLADAHLSEKKQLWKDMAEKIPEPMKKFFKFPEKDKELTDEETLANVSKLKEYTDIGAIKIDGASPPPGTPHSPPGGGPQRTDTKAWESLPPAEKIKYGYREEAKKAG